MSAMDALLLFMSHQATGGWFRLREEMQFLADIAGLDPKRAAKHTRYALEEIGFADFFTAEAGWSVQPSRLALLGDGGSAWLCGARDETLLAQMEQNAPRYNLHFERQRINVTDGLSFTLPRVCGKKEGIRALATHINLHLLPSGPEDWLRRFPSLQDTLKCAPLATEPMQNWQYQRLQVLPFPHWEILKGWPDGTMTNGMVIQQDNGWQKLRAVFSQKQNRWVDVGYREAPYAGAMLQNIPLVRYDRDAQHLCMPAAFPLPLACARAATACAGSLPRIEPQGQNYMRVYDAVPPRIADILCLLLGQQLLGDRP